MIAWNKTTPPIGVSIILHVIYPNDDNRRHIGEGKYNIGDYSDNMEVWWANASCDCCYTSDREAQVVAWMPLPEPDKN